MMRAGWAALGTYVEVLTSPHALAHARRILEDHVTRLDVACSRFRDDSELAKVNAGEAGEVSTVFLEVLQAALRAAELSDGDVDPTIGNALSDLGYDRTFTAVAPDGPPIHVVRRVVAGWRSVEVDAQSRSVLLPAGVQLDFGAIAKAWCSDTAATAIAEATGEPALVNLGGDIAVAGEHRWPIQVDDGPTVEVSSGGIATSSTLLRRWRRGNRTLHHILDPATCMPAKPVWRIVTVAAATCVDANVASTAAVVRGTRALPWLSEMRLPARLVRSDGRVFTVGGWPEEVTAA
jgi:thiamine biosynthesis lipoprotein